MTNSMAHNAFQQTGVAGRGCAIHGPWFVLSLRRYTVTLPAIAAELVPLGGVGVDGVRILTPSAVEN